jgi:hypothetical protein
MAELAAQLPPIDLRPMGRSTVHRILTEADLQPHRSRYWLTSHDPDFAARAKELCGLYLDAPRLWQEQGELVVCTDEKTGILVRRRKHPTLPCRPGLPRLREHEYVRLGMRHLHASFCVPTGQVSAQLTTSHNAGDFTEHLRQAVAELPRAGRYHWVLDNNRTHSTLAVCRAVAQLSGLELDEAQLKTARQRRAWLGDASHRHVFHFTPVHGSWLNQAELFFSVLSRKLLGRDDFAGLEAFVERFGQWLEEYNRQWAHPYRWTYAGTPLVRDTPADQTPSQKRRGRACFGPRPRYFERLFYPPRTYHKKPPAAA